MKKLFHFLISLLLMWSTSSWAVTDADFVGAKAQLLSTYQSLESNVFKLNGAIEQLGDSQEEIFLALILRSDFEMGMLAIKELLALVSLQAVQESTPEEARKMLINSCLDTTDFLNTLETRLTNMSSLSETKDVISITNYSISLITAAKAQVKVLQEFTENLK